MSYSFNQTLFRDIVVKAAGPIYVEQAFKEAQAIFELDKTKMLEDFDNHPVTEEIKEGPDAENKSGTLDREGNLFSFIGFERESDPTKNVRDVLRENTYIQKSARNAIYNRDSIQYYFPVFMPLMDVELQNAAPMPWGTARSWLKAIENGISGLNYYLFKKNYDFGKNSRSGPAIQLKGTKGEAFSAKMGGSQFRPVSYLTEILNKLRLKYK